MTNSNIYHLLIFLLIVLGSSNVFSKEEIRIANGEWVPFTSQNLKHYGLFSHIISESFAFNGIAVTYEWFPWKRALDLVKFGDWDCSPGWSITPERKEFGYFSDPIYESKAVFFHLKTYKFNWETFNDLKGVDIGATHGYIYGKEFERAEKEGIIFVERVPTDVINFRKLLKGRIKLFPANLETGFAILNKNFPPNQVKLVTYHPKPYREKAIYHLVFSKKIKRSKRMVEVFNQGLKQLKNSGKYDQYIEESRRGEYNQEVIK